MELSALEIIFTFIGGLGIFLYGISKWETDYKLQQEID